MRAWPHSNAERFAPIGLDELDAAAALRDRFDRKYIVPAPAFATLARRLSASHRALEIADHRVFEYRSTYFDSPALLTFRAHQQGRRRRFKCRSRHYVESELCVFEIKLKGPRGRTVKQRMAHPEGCAHELTPAARAFLHACLSDAYGVDLAQPLAPTLHMTYRRMTLAVPERGERVTCDFGLRFRAPDGTAGRLAGDQVIVESKSARGVALADRVLRELRVRPVAGMSKYCLGIALTRPRVTSNALLPLLRRYCDTAAPGVEALAA